MSKHQKLTHDDLIARLKQLQGDRSLREFAEALGVSAPYLSDIYNGNRKIGNKICRKLKVTRTREFVITYQDAVTA